MVKEIREGEKGENCIMNGVIRLKNTSFLVINSTVSVGGKITKKRERMIEMPKL